MVWERECKPLLWVNVLYDAPPNEPAVYGDTCGTGTGLYVDGRPWGATGVGIGIGLAVVADIDVDDVFAVIPVVVIPRPPLPLKVWP